MKYLISSLILLTSAAAQTPIGPVDLITPGGLKVTMNNYPEQKATVVLFLSTRDDGTDALATDIRNFNQANRRRGVLTIGIYSNPAQKPAEVRAYSQAHGFNFPVYLDPGMKAAKKFGATFTPSGFLIDKEGHIVFNGTLATLATALTAFDSGGKMPASATTAQGLPIDKVIPERQIPDPFGEIDFSSELIFNTIPGYPAHHCSTITEAKNGDLLVSWYGGSYESSDDQVLFLSRRKKGAKTWSKPEIIVRSPGKPPGNALLFTDKLGKIWLVWGRMDGTQPMRRGTGWDACQLFYRTSSDNGMTWTADKSYFHDTLGWLPRNLTTTLADGRLIVPISDERNGHGVDWSFFLATKDNGATWTQSGIMKGGEQPTFIERADGTIVCYMRTRPNIKAAESKDGGATWSEPKATQWKNPDAGISMTKLNNGHVILVFNNQDNARTPLHIALSTDEARTWKDPLVLETNPGEYSYPSIMQTSDGKIHIIYTFRRYSVKHIEMNEDWLTRPTRPN